MTNGNLAVSPALILLSGLPGAGKTTFARRLLAVLPAEHFESDAARLELFPTPAYTADEHARVFRLVERRAAGALLAGRHAIVDATNLLRSDRRRFLRLADRCDATLIAVRVTAPDALIRERLAGPREGLSQAGVRVYEGMLGRAQSFARPVLVVDTASDIQPSLAAVARLVESAR